MLFAYFTLGVALSISAIAAYYSIVGLTAIFAAAIVPVIIMGTALEIGKLTAAVWLKLNWTRSSTIYKLYLIPAVALLMFLTSMGIFGFLSKAHLDQGAASQENQAQIQRLTAEISRQEDIIKRSDEKIKSLETSGTGADAQVQSQIDREQIRIDAAYKRIEPAIKEQQDIINAQTKIYTDQLSKLDNDLTRLQDNLNKNDIAQVQAQVGVQPDGRIGPRTTAAIKDYRDRLSLQRQQISTQLDQINNNAAVIAARREIQRLRNQAESQIAESNTLINRLRAQVGKGNAQNIDQLVDEQQDRIKSATQEVEKLIEQKYKIESEYRKLEAEVGPVRYIAELIYGDSPDKTLLEQAVRWVIIVIVAVFDPLALVLILAAQQSIRWATEDKKVKLELNADNKLVKVLNDIDSHKENCVICDSEMIDANHLGLRCSNTNCESYVASSIEHMELKQTETIFTADSNTELDKITDVTVADKPVEAKRAFKAPTVEVPETMNVRRN